MKKIIALIVVILLMTQTIVFSESTGISVIVDGEYIVFDQSPIMQNDRVLVPLRAIFEALGATVNWDETTQSIISTKNNTTVIMQISNNTYTVNNTDKTLDVPPQIVGVRTLVPIRAIAESFDCLVNWDDSTQTVVIEGNVRIKTEKITNEEITDASVSYPLIIESTNPESMSKINEQIKAVIDLELDAIKPFVGQNFGYHLDYGIPNIGNNLFAILYTSSITMDDETQVSQHADVYRLDTGEKAVLTDYFPNMSYEEIQSKIVLDLTMIIASEPEQYYEEAAEIVSYNFDLAVVYPCGNEIVVTFNPGVIAPYDLGFKTITYPAEY